MAKKKESLVPRDTFESDPLLSFGGRGGDHSYFTDVGGQKLTFWTGDLIDAIQIGNQKYGGSGGGEGETVTIPQDGKIYLREIRAKGEVLCFFNASIGDEEFSWGNDDPSGTVAVVLPDLGVRFSGVSFEQYVDGLLFDIVGS